MSGEIVKQEKNSLIARVAQSYGMEWQTFQRVLMSTVMPSSTTPEQLAAFLTVAEKYGLSPFTKEIYAFPSKKNDGIVPVVSIDGWMRIANDNPNFDGMDFTNYFGEDGKLVSVTCAVHRKDRGHPTVITEYLSECYRNTEPWKMESRMLRHKAAIQCLRYAFGFSGIYDEDEAERIVEAEVKSTAVGQRQSLDLNMRLAAKAEGTATGTPGQAMIDVAADGAPRNF